MSEQLDKVREELAEILAGKPDMIESPCNGQMVPDPYYEFDLQAARELVDKVFSHPSICVLDADQPDTDVLVGLIDSLIDKLDADADLVYIKALFQIHDMLSAGFERVIKEVGK